MVRLFVAVIRDFHHNWAKKQGVIEYRFAQHMKRVKQLKDATASAERKRFETTLDLFRKYERNTISIR